MIGTRRKFFALTLNVLTAFMLGGVASTAYMQNARAASQDDDVKLKKFIRQSCGKGAPARLKNKCDDAMDQSFRNDVAKWNVDFANDEATRINLKHLKDEYQKQVKKTQDIESAKRALQSANSTLEKKNRALKRQASQACSTASNSENVLQSAGLAKTRSLGEQEPQLPEKLPVSLDASIPGLNAEQ